jgi:DNA polymerase-3 subunit beta
MNFVVSSTSLLSHLQAISKVISSKNTMPILDNILFEVKDGKIKATASDIETTLSTEIETETITAEGNIAIPAKILLDILKEFPEQPLTFDINTDNYAIRLTSDKGEYSLVGQNADEYPKPNEEEEAGISINTSCELLSEAINKTLFATANDELRPVMNCILFEVSNENMTFVASDAHKLVRYKRFDAKADAENNSFILPKKPATLLKNILPKKEDIVKVEFSENRANFVFDTYTLSCKLAEGKFPNYNSVIPQNNPNKIIIDRSELYNTLRRVSVVSNPASNLIKMEVSADQMIISAQDLDFSQSGHETLGCQYEGQDLAIGFKSSFLLEILSNIDSPNIVIELSDPTRPGLFLPYDNENADEDILMLLMPMMIN